MAQTIKREVCTKCRKRNLCTYELNGKQRKECKTRDCDNKISNDVKETSTAYVESKALNYQYPTEAYRGISARTCEFLGIKICTIGDVTFASYDHNNLDGSFSKKFRYANKAFGWENKTENTSMFALDKCVDFTRPLCITEGNEDCATLWDLGFQAASIHSAGCEKDNITLDIETINKFPEIILCIEQDKAGKPVINAIKELLKHKLLKICDLAPRKDANDWVQKDPDPEELKRRLNYAQEVVPKGIVFGDTLDQSQLWENPPLAIPFPWQGLTDTMTGLEYGNLYAIFGGSSTGKSTVLREMVYYWRTEHPNLKIANIFLEENQKITPLVYLSLATNIPIGQLKRDKSLIPEDQRAELYDRFLNTPNLMFINEDYERDSDNLIKTIKYLAEVKKYDIIMLDHISYVIGRSKVGKNGERRDIDELLYNLQDLARNLNCIIIFACHLSDPHSPPGWDEGRVPSMYNGRGSRVLAQVPDGIIGISRNMLDEYKCDILGIHNLKNRWDGKLGLADELVYIHSTGRLIRK